MSPILEIETRELGRWGDPVTIADLPDESGKYQTSEGEIELDMSKTNNGKGDVVLSGEFLKGHERMSGGPQFGATTRIVSIGKHNKGSIMLDGDHKLIVTLND